MQQKYADEGESKMLDTKFYWHRDSDNNNHFKVYYDKGKNNLVDYPTKHHHTIHHRTMMEKSLC